MNAKYNFTFSGFLIALITISMFATIFGATLSDLQTNYNTTGNDDFSKYSNYTDNIKDSVKNITEASNINGEDNSAFDIIGGYFAGGYAALKTSFGSISMFTAMMSDAASDVPQLNIISTYLVMIITIALIIGVIVAALVKLRI